MHSATRRWFIDHEPYGVSFIGTDRSSRLPSHLAQKLALSVQQIGLRQ
ncbi:MAG TPA: hypothetical protein VKY19_25590 [Ktedonosporobacter sp.]|nr:hypothetical protein [Ktedonosporobacter sp.]